MVLVKATNRLKIINVFFLKSCLVSYFLRFCFSANSLFNIITTLLFTSARSAKGQSILFPGTLLFSFSCQNFVFLHLMYGFLIPNPGFRCQNLTSRKIVFSRNMRFSVPFVAFDVYVIILKF